MVETRRFILDGLYLAGGNWWRVVRRTSRSVWLQLDGMPELLIRRKVHRRPWGQEWVLISPHGSPLEPRHRCSDGFD